MSSTLDTNIILYTALGNATEKGYAKDFLAQDFKFLTRQVYTEINKVEERITLFEILLRSHMEEDETPKETFSRIEDNLSQSWRTRLNSYFLNIVEYYDRKYRNGDDIEDITEDLMYEITVYTSMERIRPTDQSLEKNQSAAEKYRGVIEEYELVDREDTSIIVQLQVFQDVRGGNIELITRDSGFNTDQEEWDEHFPKISVKDLSSS